MLFKEETLDEICKIRGYDSSQKRMIMNIVMNSIEFVRYFSDEKDISKIENNFVNFMALVIKQLEEFSKGKNEGPLFNFITQNQEDDTKNYYDC